MRLNIIPQRSRLARPLAIAAPTLVGQPNSQTQELIKEATLSYAILLPGQKSVFRTGFRPDSNRKNFKSGPPAGRKPTGGPILTFSRLESGRNPSRKPDFRPGSTIAEQRLPCWHADPFERWDTKRQHFGFLWAGGSSGQGSDTCYNKCKMVFHTQ
jgi:hypothetical protein